MTRPLLIAIGLVAILLAAAIQLRADASQRILPTPTAQLQSAPATPTPPAELVLIRPQGTKGELVAYDTATARPRFRLARGVPSADWQHYFTVGTLLDDTVLQAYDPLSGERQQRFELPGLWTLGGVSASGRWLGLRRIADDREMHQWVKANEWKTDVAVVDTSDGHIAQRIMFDDNYEVQSLSDDGHWLYLLQYVPPINPDYFVPRVYDLVADTFVPLPDPSTKLSGQVWDSTASRDGRWSAALYVDWTRQVAFLQTLDLLHRRSFQLSLPVGGGTPAELESYLLVLSPDGQKVYVANGAIRVVLEVDLATGVIRQRLDFAAPFSQPAMDYGLEGAPSQGAFSPHGNLLYFASGHDVWVYDTGAGQAHFAYSTNVQIQGLGLNRAGTRLYAAGAADLARVFIAERDGTLVPLN